MTLRISMNIGRVVFYTVACLVVVLLVLFAEDLLDSSVEYWRGCAGGQAEVISAEDAIQKVKNEYLVGKFLLRYPDILKSEEYLHSIRMASSNMESRKSGWKVERSRVGFGREILDVSFLYKFQVSAVRGRNEEKILEVDVECSMTRCNPRPRCRYIED
jgi:hypothetical protein